MEAQEERQEAGKRSVFGNSLQSNGNSSIIKSTECRRLYTKDEQIEIQARLNKYLGPEYITNRKDKVKYLTIHHAIELANFAFGFNGWSTSSNVNTGWVEEGSTKNKWTANAFATVRITLPDGTYREDEGWGESINFPSRGGAIHKARKHAISDGLKRALRQFGSLTGNCLKDDDYLKKVASIKVPPRKYNLSELHRPGIQNVTEGDPSTTDTSLPYNRALAFNVPNPTDTINKHEEPEDEFGGEPDFDGFDLEASSVQPTALAVVTSALNQHKASPINSVPQGQANGLNGHSKPSTAQNPNDRNSSDRTSGASASLPASLSRARQPPPENSGVQIKAHADTDGSIHHNNLAHSAAVPVEVSFTAAPRPLQTGPTNPQPFNLNAGNLRKTDGIDHSKSSRVMRDEVAANGPRQIGRPPVSNGVASPVQNRGHFKMPRQAIGTDKVFQGVKREMEGPGDTYGGQVKRQALTARPQ